MKKILFLILLPSILYGQSIVKGSGVLYTNGVPSHSINRNSDAEVAIDTTTGLWYEKSNDGLGWLQAGFRVQKFNSSSAPTFTPSDKQSEIVLNNVDSLYRYRSGAWRHLNKNRVYLAGSGITITGNLIAAKDTSPTNELQVLSTSGTSSATVTLDKSGGSFTIRGVNRTTVTHASGTITVSSNADADSLANNEGINGVGAGSGTTATIISNTPGASPITIQAGTAINISETPGSNGGTITISNGGDLSNTNEPLTISDGTDTETLAGQTLTVVGTGSVTADYTPGTNTLTINSSGGGSVSRPATEVVVGTGSSITSSPNLVTDGTNLILGTGTTTTSGFRLELIGTGKGDRTFGIGGLPMVYLPDQTNFIGNMAFGTGLRALSHSTGAEGLYNTTVGYASGDSIGIGFGNTTLGYFAGSRLKTSFDNTFIGALAGANMGLTGGYVEDDNIFVGIKAGEFADNISNTILIGADAGQRIGSGVTTGGNSVMIGNEAGRFLYDYNTFKYYADSSLYLGFRASGGLVDNVRNENVIGAMAWGMGSNTMVLGGDMLRQTLLQGKVGVRTRTPGAWMDIRGNDASAATGTEAMLKLTRETRSALSYPQTATFSVGNSGAAHRWGSYDPMTRVDLKLNKQTSGTPTFADIVAMTWTDAGFVGIGDTMPLALLHVGSRPGGEPTYRGDIIVNQSTPTGANGGVEWKVDGNAAGYGYRQVAAYDGVSSYPFLFQSRHNSNTWATRMTLTQGGELGINVSVPTQIFDLGGNARIRGAIYDSNNEPGTSGQVLASTVTGTDWVDATGGAANLSYTGVLSPITLNSSTGTDVDFKDSTGIRISRAAGVMTILNTGDTNAGDDVTIGTTNYVQKVTGATALGNSGLYDDGTNMGLRTTTPLARLQVGEIADGNPTNEGDITIHQQGIDAANVGGIAYKVDGAGSGYGWRHKVAFDGASTYNFLLQSRINSATWTERFVFNPSGLLGIGTYPTAGLHLGAGRSIKIDDFTTAGNVVTHTSGGVFQSSTPASIVAAGGGIQRIDTFSLVSNILRLSLSGDTQPFKTVDLSGYVNTDAQTLSIPVTNTLAISGGNSVTVDTDPSNDITTSTTAGGDLSGTYPNPLVDGLQGVGISATTPTTNQVLKYNGTTWAPAADVGGSGTTTGTGAANQVAVWTGTNSQAGYNDLWWDNTNKRFGVGTGGAPSAPFQINGAANGYGFEIQPAYPGNGSSLLSYNRGSSAWGDLDVNFNNLLLYSGTGSNANFKLTSTGYALFANANVGIGTTIPLAKLHIGVLAGGEPTYRGDQIINQAGASEAGNGGLEFKTDAGGSGYGFRQLGVYDGGSSYDLRWQARSNSASWTTRMNLTNAGKLGIGVTPAQKLDVNGILRVRSVSGITPTTLIGRDANGDIGTVGFGSGFSIVSGNITYTPATTYYQTVMSNHTPVAQEAALDFVPTPRIQQTVTDNPGNNRTQVSFDIPAGGVTSTEIADATVTSTDMSATGVGAGSCTNCDLTIDAAGRVTVKGNGSSGGGTALSAITAATSTNTIDNLNFTQTWNWSTQATGNAFAYNYGALTTGTAVVHTADALTTGGILQLSSNSASLNSTAGILAVKNNNTSTNGAVFSVFANSTAGRGMYVRANGRVGVNTTVPISMMNVNGVGYFGSSRLPSIESTLVGGVDSSDFRYSTSIENRMNTSGGHATLYAKVGGTSGGDPATIYDVPGGASWSVGIDNSATGDPLIISASQTVGTTPVLKMLSSGVSEVILDRTLTAGGTTSSQTINKLAGSVNMAAAATSLIVTNSLVNTSSLIFCQVMTNDGTMKSVQAVAGSGLFTLYPNVAPTGETKIAFMVTN